MSSVRLSEYDVFTNTVKNSVVLQCFNYSVNESGVRLVKELSSAPLTF